MNKKHKQLIKQLKQQSPCTITPEDIYKNTEFFNNTTIKHKSTFKLAFMISIILMFISLTFTITLSIQNYKLKNKEPEIVYIEKYSHIIDDTQGMPKEEKDLLIASLYKFPNYPVASYAHNNEIVLYLYYGYNFNTDLSKTYYYYYAFSESIKYYPSFNIYTYDKVLVVSSDNRYGLLTTLNEKETTDFTISFIVETEDKKCEYVLKNCNFE